jgi:hypothetical protein
LVPNIPRISQPEPERTVPANKPAEAAVTAPTAPVASVPLASLRFPRTRRSMSRLLFQSSTSWNTRTHALLHCKLWKNKRTSKSS